ncbi:MAG: GspL/Epsl periplasmic domain-containing protein [Nitrospirota bacterium]
MSKSIFIDIKEEEVNIYIFEAKYGKYEITDSKKYPLTDKYNFPFDELSKNIENAYLSLPLSHLNFRIISLPFSDKNKIQEVIPFELNGMILGGADKVIFDSIVTGSTDNKYEVLVAYADRIFIKEILEKLKSYNIDPEFITSIELKNILKDFSLDKLLAPPLVEDKERLSLAIEEVKAPSINLRRDEFSYTRDIEKTRRSLKATTALAILVVVVLSASLLLKILYMRHETASLKKEIRKEYTEIFPDEKKVINELYQLKSHMKELKEKEQILIGVAPLNVLLGLSKIDRKGVVFNEIIMQNGNLALKGEAQSLGDVQQIKIKLEDIFNDVKISDSKTSVQGKVLFTITAAGKKA